ncbi:MAG TPA: serine/threonine protein kinase [Lautropia sp.]|nr:serine/threonine protein kinase [Lautropia sp.]
MDDDIDDDAPRARPAPHSFASLGPDEVLEALEAIGIRCDGSLQALNSFENRVYLVGLEDGGSCVAKFYRPDRWRNEQILEEHRFALELVEAEIPVVAPDVLADGSTLAQAAGYRFAVYPRQGGRSPELDNAIHGPAMRDRIGQFIGRIHNIGARAPFIGRPEIGPQTYGHEPIAIVRESQMLPPELESSWLAIAGQCVAHVEARFQQAGDVATLRLHGDCHLGNLLWTDDGPHFVDLDDCRTGVSVQDLWMLADAGRDGTQEFNEGSRELDELLSGYEKLRAFDRRELLLVEPLRTLRMIHYSAWLVQRRDDPAFQVAFPWFNTVRYWQDQILYLREQLGNLQG